MVAAFAGAGKVAPALPGESRTGHRRFDATQFGSPNALARAHQRRKIASTRRAPAAFDVLRGRPWRMPTGSQPLMPLGRCLTADAIGIQALIVECPPCHPDASKREGRTVQSWPCAQVQSNRTSRRRRGRQMDARPRSCSKRSAWRTRCARSTCDVASRANRGTAPSTQMAAFPRSSTRGGALSACRGKDSARSAGSPVIKTGELSPQVPGSWDQPIRGPGRRRFSHGLARGAKGDTTASTRPVGSQRGV